MQQESTLVERLRAVADSFWDCGDVGHLLEAAAHEIARNDVLLARQRAWHEVVVGQWKAEEEMWIAETKRLLDEIERLNARIRGLEALAIEDGYSYEEMAEAIEQVSGVSPLQRGPVPQGPFTVDL